VTTRREKLLIVKNATANLVRGSASAVVALILPPLLIRSMSPDAFSAWSLILQLSAYVGYLDFGIQTAIARFVAHATERKDAAHRDKIVSTAVACLSASGLLAFLGLILLALFLPHLFHHLPGYLLLDVRLSVLLVGGSLALGLPASVFAGTFVGLQRNEIPAAIIGISRILNASLLILIVRSGGGIRAMAFTFSTVNLASYLVQFIAYQRVAVSLEPTMSISMRHVSWDAALELADYCTSLTVWGLGMVLVTGLDLTIVGVYRFDEVGYYAVAATLVTFLAGVFGALFGALGSPAAVFHARSDKAGLGRMVSVTTRLGMLLLLTSGLPLIFGASHILRLWVGATYSQHAAALVQILVVANIVRLCATPYVIAMIGTGEQRRIILVPLLEGATNLASSLVAGYYFGAAGVALGTLIGSFFSLGGHLIYNIGRNTTIQLSASEYLRTSILRPIFCSGPMIIIGMLWPHLTASLQPWLTRLLLIGVCLLTGGLVWYIGLAPDERKAVVLRMRLTRSVRGKSNDRL
jgi:O-antigen/teichoic acid export membrane protein